MMQLKDVNVLKRAFCNICEMNDGKCDIEGIYCVKHYIIDTAPTIEAEPVKHGQWVNLSGWCNRGIVKCSKCGNTLDMHGVNAGRGDANFCPNCGAKMDKGE